MSQSYLHSSAHLVFPFLPFSCNGIFYMLVSGGCVQLDCSVELVVIVLSTKTAEGNDRKNIAYEDKVQLPMIFIRHSKLKVGLFEVTYHKLVVVTFALPNILCQEWNVKNRKFSK